MSTIREQILAAIAAKLAAVPAVTVYRSRETAIARVEGNAIVVLPETEQVEQQALVLTMRDFLVAVTVLVRGEIPDQTADPILQSAHALLMSDPTLGNLCAQILEHSTEWKMEQADLAAGEVTIRYMIRYRTLASDLTRLL